MGDRQPPRYLRGRDSHENHANFDVSAADGPGDPGLHLECVQLPRYPEK